MTLTIPRRRVGTRTPRALKRYGLRLIAVVAAVLLWQVLAMSDLGRIGDVPTPFEALSKLVELAGSAGYWSAVGVTMLSWLVGLLVSIAIGVPVGLLIGTNRRAEMSTRLVVDFLRTIPAIAFLPLALLIFGTSLQTPIALIFFAAVWPLLIQSTYAALEIDPVLKQVRRSFHLSWWQYIRYGFAPSSLPFITTGLRIAATICLLTAISVELLSGAPGVGAELQKSMVVSQTASLYAYVLTAGVLGVLVNVVLLWVQRLLLWWHPSVRGDAR